MIKRSPHVPDFARKGIKAKGNLIVGPTKIKQPEKTIPRDWPDDLAAVFASSYWEISTALETFELVKDPTGMHVERRILVDLQTGEFGPGYWFDTGPNERTWSPDNYSFDTSYELGGIGLEFGETFSSAEVNKHAKAGQRTAETRLKSGRALIIVVNRVTVYGVKPANSLLSWFLPGFADLITAARQFTVPEPKLLATFLHELSVHAGRMNQGKSAVHGDSTVEFNVIVIDELFPKDTTMDQVTGALREAEARLKELDKNVSPTAKGRTPGPLKGPSAGARPPGPLR